MATLEKEKIKAGIESGRLHLQRLIALAQNQPFLRDRLIPETVQTILSLEKRYNELTGFSEIKNESFNIACRFSGSEIVTGNIPGDIFAKLSVGIQAFFGFAHDRLGARFPNLQLDYAGISEGSSVLLIKIRDTGNLFPIDEDSIEIVEEELDRIFKSYRALLRGQTIDTRAYQFSRKLNLTDSQANKIIDLFLGIIPHGGKDGDALEISLPFRKSKTKFLPDHRDILIEISKVYKDAENEEGNIKIIEGELGSTTEWSSDFIHKFRVRATEDIDGRKRSRTYIISYNRDNTIDNEVKQRLKQNVRVKIARKDGKWIFLNWEENQ